MKVKEHFIWFFYFLIITGQVRHWAGEDSQVQATGTELANAKKQIKYNQKVILIILTLSRRGGINVRAYIK